MSYKKNIYINNYKYTHKNTHLYLPFSHFAIPPLCFIFLLNVVFSLQDMTTQKKNALIVDDDYLMMTNTL